MITLVEGDQVMLRSHDPVKFGKATTMEYTYRGNVWSSKDPKNGKLIFDRERRTLKQGTMQEKKYTMEKFQKKVDNGEVLLKDPTTRKYVNGSSHLFKLGTKKLQAQYDEKVKNCIVEARADGTHGYEKATKVDGLAHLEDDYSDGLYQYDGHDDFYDYDEHGDYYDDAEDENYGGYEGYNDFREAMYDGDWQEGYTAGYHAAMQRLYRVIDAVPFIHRGHWRN